MPEATHPIRDPVPINKTKATDADVEGPWPHAGASSSAPTRDRKAVAAFLAGKGSGTGPLDRVAGTFSGPATTGGADRAPWTPWPPCRALGIETVSADKKRPAELRRRPVARTLVVHPEPDGDDPGSENPSRDGVPFRPSDGTIGASATNRR